MYTQSVVSETSMVLLDFLRRPSSYPNQPKFVDSRETHISWVFLAGRYAYKLKKPVRYDFLDFSSCELRKQACEAELRLNRRLSPSVYRAVVPICRNTSGWFTLGADGQAVDWLVKMRRLDDDRTLKAWLSNPAGAVDLDSQINSVATHLAQFYATQAPVTIRTSEFRQSLRRHVEENEHQLLQITSSRGDQNSVRRVHSAQKRFLVTHQDVFDNRVRDGRIVDGHGDLRPEHIYLYNRPLVIDCVEFNAEYRTNDIADELAFLAMECDRLGDCSVGRRLFDEYARISQDTPSPRLVAFYKVYRACVRAKVAALRGQQQESTLAASSSHVEHEYLDLAENHRPEMGPRVVLMVGGLMGTGKSTLAEQLGQLLSAEIISSDMIRQSADNWPNNNGEKRDFGQGEYSDQARMGTYKSMMTAAAHAFDRNDTVVLDATFCSQATRNLAARMANAHAARLLQVECTCPREIAIDRIAERISRGGSASEAVPEFYDLQIAEAEPPLPTVAAAQVDTTLALGRQEAIVLEKVQEAIR